jgi:hypothetical protein
LYEQAVPYTDHQAVDEEDFDGTKEEGETKTDK